MAHALFLFDDRRAAEQAAIRLVDQGLPADAVVLHVDEPTAEEHIGSEVDEVLTGGFVSNLAHLLRGVFEWGSELDIEPYEEALRRGAAVLRVEARGKEQQAMVDRSVQEGGCRQRTEWIVAAAR